MPKAKVEHEFPCSPADLWDLIGNFGDMGRWTGRPPEACTREGEGIGSFRTITLDNGGQIVDRLDAESPYSYSYSIVRSPLPVRTYSATMTVVPVSAAISRLIWSGEFEPVGMSESQAIAFWENIYRMGIGLMETTIRKKAG